MRSVASSVYFYLLPHYTKVIVTCECAGGCVVSKRKEDSLSELNILSIEYDDCQSLRHEMEQAMHSLSAHSV